MNRLWHSKRQIALSVWRAETGAATNSLGSDRQVEHFGVLWGAKTTITRLNNSRVPVSITALITYEAQLLAVGPRWQIPRPHRVPGHSGFRRTLRASAWPATCRPPTKPAPAEATPQIRRYRRRRAPHRREKRLAGRRMAVGVQERGAAAVSRHGTMETAP